MKKELCIYAQPPNYDSAHRADKNVIPVSETVYQSGVWIEQYSFCVNVI